MIDFVLKKDENYYPQMSLKECKHIEKEKKVIIYITDDLGRFPDSDESVEEQIGLCVTFSASHL